MNNNQLKHELDKYIGEFPLLKQEDSDRFYNWVLNGKDYKRNKLRKWLVAVLISLIVLFSAGVATAYIPVINKIVSLVSPETALLLQPIEKSKVYNGIKMETVAAIHDDEMAIIYVTLQDLSKDRIDSTVDLYDFSLSGAQMFNSQLVDYDESSNTATLRILANGGEELDGKKVNFQIRSFLSKKQTHTFIERDIFSKISRTPETMSLDRNNVSGGGGLLYRSLEARGTFHVLKPNPTEINIFETDFMEITNIGVIEGRLHIQVRWKGNHVDSHGYFTFTDGLGNEVRSSNVSFRLDENMHTTDGNKFTEYIFNVNEVDNPKYELHGEFIIAGKHEEGNWDTTFRLESIENSSIEARFEENIGDWRTEKLIVSPLGVTLYGEGNDNEVDRPKVEVIMTNDEVINLVSSKVVNNKGEIKVKVESDFPLNTDEIRSIIINGIEVQFKGEKSPN